MMMTGLEKPRFLEKVFRLLKVILLGIMLLFLMMPVQVSIFFIFSPQCKHFTVITKTVKLINNKHKPLITSAIFKSVRRKYFCTTDRNLIARPRLHSMQRGNK